VSSSAPPAGFYADPFNPRALRYWDGTEWSRDRVFQPTYTPMPVPVDPRDITDGRLYVGPFRAFALAFRQYAKFSGRASRSEYWWWTLATLISVNGAFTVMYADGIAHARAATPCVAKYGTLTMCSSPPVFWTTTAISIAFGVLLIAMIVPTLSVTVRRLHDSNLPGWPVGFMAAPLVLILVRAAPLGTILSCSLWVMAVRPTSLEATKYGFPPSKGKPRK
jgi:uncharacterized membrane protein YhaH (DUF805 family)